jgi:hypothetical protein
MVQSCSTVRPCKTGFQENPALPPLAGETYPDRRQFADVAKFLQNGVIGKLATATLQHREATENETSQAVRLSMSNRQIRKVLRFVVGRRN